MSRAKPRANLLRMGRPLAHSPSVCLLLLALFFTATGVHAQTAGYQEYYVLGYEEHVWQAFNRINDGGSVPEPICSTVSLVAAANHQVVYYDHWEDGYEADLLHPIQSSTEVYTLTVGASLSLTSTQSGAQDPKNQPVDVDSGRDPGEIRYDGGDRIITSGGPVALTHMMWPLDNSWVGGAWEVYSLEAYADTYSYHVPIGEDLYTFGGGDTGTYGDFRNVYLEIAAFEDNTTISIDNRTDTVNLNLNRGQSYSSLGYINSTAALSITINVGTTIRSNNPVQVGLITGSDGAFQGRFLIVLPDEHLGADYVVPVPSGNPPNEAEVYLSNPNDFPITVHAYDAAVPYTNFVISPTGYISATVPYSEKRGGSYVPADSAARFTSSDGVFGVVVCADTSEIGYDWGFAGIPTKYLTRDYYVSWAPGDYNIPPQNNGSPVWVTPIGDHTTFYVDYGPLDGIVDQTFTLNILEQRRIFDPDMDNTGMHIWANGEFAAVWGEDPTVAGTEIPYLDLGYSVLPPYQQWLDPVMTLDKTAEPTVLPPAGGTVTFTLVAQAYSGPIVNVSISDTLPISWTYVPGSTTVQYPDGSTTSPDPAIDDPTLFWNLQTTLDVGQSLTLTFQAQIVTAGSVGTAIYDGFESQTYTGGDNWSGPWQEMGDDGEPWAGGVSIADTTPFLGDYHLSIISATQSLSRTVGLNEFTSPVLRFARNVSMTASSEYYLDVRGEAGWTTVLTWTNSNLQGTYVQETVDLARTDTAIRFQSGNDIGTWVHLYVDEVEIYDAIAANTNRGEVIGQFQYAGTDFSSTDAADVAISPLKVIKSVNATNVQIKDTLAYTLSYANPSDSVTATNVLLYDAIPIQFVTFQSASNGGTYSGASGTITWTLDTLEPGDSGNVTFTVMVNDFVEDGTVVKNTAYIVSAQTAAAGSNTVRTSVQAPDIAFTKSGPTVAEQGRTITYTLSYENAGGAQATGTVIWDAIPLSTTYVTDSMAIWTGSDWTALSDGADGDLGTYVPLSSTLTVTPGNVAAGEAGAIRFNVQIDQGLSPGSLIRNWATLDRDMDIPRESNLAVTRISELLIDKSAETAASLGGSGLAVAPGELITYFLTYENVSTTTAQTDVYVREPIPDYTDFVTASGAISYSWNHGAGWSATEPITPITHIRWYESALPTTTRRVVSFTVQVNDTLPANVDIENIAYISSTEIALYPGGWIPSNQVEVETVDLWLEKRANPSLVGAGGAVSYTISYANRGSADAFDVRILDTIPANTRYVTGSIYGTGSDASGDPSLTWDVMTVTAGARVQTVGYAVTVDTGLIPGSAITNTAVVSSAYGQETSDPVPVTVVSSADLAVVKSVEQGTVDAGDKLTYTVVISNDGPGSAFGAVLSDTFSTEVQLVPNSISLDPPGVGTEGTDLPILANDVTITGGQRVTVTFAVTIAPPVPNGTIVTNTASVTSTYTPTPTTDLVTITVHSPILTVTKRAARSVVRAGEVLQYNVIISNTGQGHASGVLISDTLPAHTDFVDATPAPIGPLNGVITWPLGTLDTGATQPITVVVRVDSSTVSGTLITNTVAVLTSQGITATDAATTSVETAANLAVTKGHAPALFVPGETLTYTLTYANYGPSDAQSVTITDTLPTSVTYGSIVSSPLPDPTPDGQSLTWHTPTLPAGESGTIVFTTTVGDDAFQAITNTVTITSVTVDPNWSNNRFVRVTNEFPEVHFASASFSAGESDSSAIITVVSSYPFISPITVTYQTATGGTATPGIDYVPTNGAVTIPAWMTSQTFTVSILPDPLDEYDETVVLSLTGTSTGTFGTINNPAMLTIIDDDPSPSLSIDDVSVYEGDSGSVDAVFNLSLDAVSGRTVWVDYVTADDTATAPADYDAVSTTTLDFAPGETARQITVTVQGDTMVEGDETYLVNLASIVNATAADSQGTGTIIDDDAATASIIPQDDGAEPSDDGHFVVALTYQVATPLTVDYVVSGTADNGIDYAPLLGSVIIPTRAVSTTITVDVLDDSVVESPETVHLTLTTTDNPRVSVDPANDEAAITIADDYDTATVTVTTRNDGAEPNTDGGLLLSLSEPVAGELIIDYVVGGTAENGTDYVALPGTVIIPANSLTLPLTVAVIDDAVYEGDETVEFVMTVTSNPRVSVGTPASATLSIADDEKVSVDFTSNTYVVGESDSDATVTVALSCPSTFPITLSYQTATGGTATPGADYATISETLVFPALVTDQAFTVPIISDTIDEPDETIVLVLTEAISATVATANNPATLTIVDDDKLVVDFASATYEGSEASGTALITVVLNTISTWQTATVDYATNDDTAIAPDDYAAIGGTLTFAPGVAQLTFTVAIVDDGVYEGTEAVHLALSSPVNATVGTTSNPATLVIQDNISNVAVIRGTVFKDANGNGRQDGGEDGLPDVLVTLDGTMTTTTNAAGDYFLVTTILGAHTVIETDPRALVLNLLQRAPASPMDQPDYVSTTPNQVNVSVALGNIYPVDFGDAKTDMGFGAIYGIAFEDVDGDGVQGPTEMGIPDVPVALDGAGTLLTDLNGSYTFSATLPGVHAVAATQPGGYFATTPPQVQTDVILGLGYQIDFGNAPDSAGFAAIYGTLFGDDNADGTYGADETGVPGVSITLDGNMVATTDRYGDYTFASTMPGTHVVLETDPNGYSSTTPNTVTVNVTLGNGYQVNFGDMEITTCEPDLYEHDEITENVRVLFVGTNQVRQFCDDAIDQAWFTARAGGVYTITTTSWGQRADTILTLFDTDWQTSLAQNDDYLVENNDGSSRIVWQAPVEGDYCVRITNKRDLTGERTDYYLRLQGEGITLSVYLPIVMRNPR